MNILTFDGKSINLDNINYISEVDNNFFNIVFVSGNPLSIFTDINNTATQKRAALVTLISENGNSLTIQDPLNVTTSTGGVGDLSDVTITSVANNDQLKYNSTSSKWENFAPTNPNIESLPDVTITSVANNDQLKYNSTSSKWENFAPTNPNIESLPNVTISNPTAGQVLTYDATNSVWKNSTL